MIDDSENKISIRDHLALKILMFIASVLFTSLTAEQKQEFERLRTSLSVLRFG